MKKVSFIIIIPLIFAFLSGTFHSAITTTASETETTQFKAAPVAVFLVTKTADTNDGACDADCSLREAVNAANAATTDDIINFDPAVFTPMLPVKTITLAGGQQLEINNNGTLTINGTGASWLSVHGNNATRVFRINAGANVTINGVQVERGNSSGAQGGGGGIYNGGTLVLNGVTVTNNNSGGNNGGGIYNEAGTINMTDSTVSNNVAGMGDGGGIYNTSGTLSLSNVTVSGNAACLHGCRGGGIFSSGNNSSITLTGVNVLSNSATDGGGFFLLNNGTANLFRSTVSANTAGIPSGGTAAGIAFVDGGTLNLTNSTVANNNVFGPSSGAGGISVASGTLNLNHTTVAHNQGGSNGGGGIRRNSGTVNLRSSIIADNSAINHLAADVVGALTSQGYNLIENTTGATITGATTGDILDRDAQLLPLRNNGGATQTVALQPTSPAVDAADPNNFPPTDQRGIARPQDGDLNGSALPDIGAYERQVFVSTVTKSADTNDGVCDADCSLREAIAVVNAATTPDNAIVFDASVFSSPQTITLTQGQLQININRSAAIYGRGAELLTISGNNQSRVFFVGSGSLLSILGATVTGGRAVGEGSAGLGGGFYATNNSFLTISDSVVTGNIAREGGGIYSGANLAGGTLNVLDSVVSVNSAETDGGGALVTGTEANFINSNVSANAAGNFGGGIYFLSGRRLNISNSSINGNGGGLHSINSNGTISINNSIFAGNTIRGGVHSAGTLLVTNSTFVDNSTQSAGGGIENRGTLHVTNSTFSSNSATVFGGGIFNSHTSDATIMSSTIVNNTTDGIGGGVFRSSTADVIVGNTIIAGNSAVIQAPDFESTMFSLGYNLIGNTSGMTITGTTTGNILNQNPQLFPLGNYGGATPTHALRPNSPAVDKGNSFGITTDQRMLIRPFDNPAIPNAPDANGADIGAFERQASDFIPRTFFDYDGDGRADISVFRPSSGSWYISQSSNNAFLAVQFGANGDLIAPADFDADGKTDISVFRPTDGTWYRLNSSNNTFSAVQFGSNGDLPAPGDFDGDSKADITVYRPSAGSWYRINSSNNQFVGIQFGIAEDKPIIGDFDGDAKSDLAVFRPSNGTWYRINSSNNLFSANQFGSFGDLPVAADYDGDGKTDLAVYRPSNGTWYRINSSNNSFAAHQFGVTEDKPAPADFDGDAKADLVVFRPSNGTWYLLRSTDGFTGIQFGTNGDLPTPNAFVR